MDEDLYLGIIDRLAAGDDTLAKLAASLDQRQQEVADAVGWAVGSLLVRRVPDSDGERLELTPQGQLVVDLRAQAVDAPAPEPASDIDLGSVPQVDLQAMANELSRAWTMAQGVQIAAFQSVQSGLLVGDVEREAATNTLEEAYAAGRLDRAELDRRLDIALDAKNRGDLDRAVEGLVEPVDVVGSITSTISQWLGFMSWISVGVIAAVMVPMLIVILIVLFAVL